MNHSQINILINDVFYIFLTRKFIFRSTVVRTVMVYDGLHAAFDIYLTVHH